MVRKTTDFTRIYDFIYKIDRRIIYLEKDAAFIEEKINTINSLEKTKYADLQLEFDKIKSDIKILRDKLQDCIIKINNLGHELKNSVKKEQVEAVKENVESIPFTDFITVLDLKKGIF